MKKIIILRILLSPFVFLWALFFTICMFAFPAPLLILISLIQLIGYPFILLLNKSGADIEIPEPFVNETKSYAINYFLTLTLPIWGMFAYTIYYILTGKLMKD